MKNLIKGMIIFFAVIIILLTGFLIYGLVRGNGEWNSLDRLRNGNLIHTEEIPLDGIKAIQIKAYSSDVIFKETDDTKITVKEYSSKKNGKSFIKTDTSGDHLMLVADKRNQSWFIFNSSFRYIEVYLPKDYQDKMFVDTSSGDITADYAFSFSEFSTGCSSGSAYLHSIHADQVSMASSSGDVQLEQELITGDLEIATSSGDIRLKTVSAKQVDFGTSSGDIHVEKISGKLDAQTSSGYISVEDITGSGSFQTSSGDVNIGFASLTDNLTLDTSSGTVKCRLPEDSQFEFNADTTSGDIRTFFDDTLSYNRKGNHAQGTIGENSKYDIDVSTSSGDIRFLEN